MHRRGGWILVALLAAAVGLGVLLGKQIEGTASLAVGAGGVPAVAMSRDYQRAVYDPLHFKPAIETARDEQCLACHREVLEDRVRETSPSGTKAAASLAWYQQLSSYQGEQDTFHRRHLVSALARETMRLACNTCHQGHDPRDEAPGTSATAPARDDPAFILRKQVNPETVCLKCHGQFPAGLMGLPGPWAEHREAFGNNCLSCHQAIRTHRHQVSYLKAEAIEAAGAANSDVCYGCHGGRPWYRISYPYPRHPWPGMAEEIPAWAKGRPTASEPRFQLPQ